MSARTTKNTRWSEWTEPSPELSLAVDLDCGVKRDPWTDLVPIFPITSFTRESDCPHRGPIRKGSVFVCMVCHQAGKDGSPALPLNVQRLKDDPKPPDIPPEKTKGHDGSRKSEQWAPYAKKSTAA